MLKTNLVKNLYKSPKEVMFCKMCTMSNQRPRITFNDEGVCSACDFATKKKKFDWKKRNEELKKLCDKHRKSNGDYDVVVPCSGGKDGSYVAHQLKNEYGMHPLCVTWSPLIYTEIGRKNLDNFIKSGFNHILVTPNASITKKLAEFSVRSVGDPFQPFVYGQMNMPLTIALKFGINIIMYGENGEVEYGGDMKSAYTPTRNLDDYKKYYFSGISPEKFSEFGINKKDLKIFSTPDINKLKENKIEIHFYSYYKFWDPQENFYYAQEHCGFEPNPERTEGTYSKYASLDDQTDGFHYYLQFIKFGFGRTTSDTAHEIRDGKINREEGISLVKKYDGEFPNKYYQKFLKYCSITEKEFEIIVDSWRSEHIWTKDKFSNWILKNPIWK